MEAKDLKTYLNRIGFSRDASPTLEVLNQITGLHTKSIAFENLDPLLNKQVLLTDNGLFDKLVVKKRGGYCFEQNGLLLTVLKAIGFDVKPISARVRLRFSDRGPVAPRTHVFLRVEINGQSYMTDVGMGSGSLTKALELVPDIEQDTPHDLRKLENVGGRWFHQISYGYGNGWIDACEFTLEEMPLIDREVANWYTSAHPTSHFRDKIAMARARDNGERISLDNFDFTIRRKAAKLKSANSAASMNSWPCW